MKPYKILHIILLDKFGIPFLKFLDENLEIKNHQFVFFNVFNQDESVINGYNAFIMRSRKQAFRLLRAMYSADKIILHGLWVKRVTRILFFQPWLLKKCYWVMWGGDFYFPENHSWITKQVIKRIGHLVTYIEGDVSLVRELYGARGIYHECLMYPSNLYKPHERELKTDSTVHIQVGNSADPTNNHLEVLYKLRKYRDDDIRISIPLSYCDDDKNYLSKVKTTAQTLFGNKVTFLTHFMLFDEYMKFLNSIDIAIFAHNRQQGMGNIISLLGMGKKIYLRNDVTHKSLFRSIGVITYDIELIDMRPMPYQDNLNNRKRMEKFFSKERLRVQLIELFNRK